MQINSVNPSLAAGAPGEREIAQFVASWLDEAGLATEVCELHPGRPSVLAHLKGSGAGRSLMLNAHYDTVDVGGMLDPFSGAFNQGRIYGRGSYDMKGSLAACMMAAQALAHEPLRGDLWIAAVADEEYGSIGTSEVLSRVHVDAAIVTEPTALRICLAHKGYLWIEVEVTGRAAHGSRFDLGIDANLKMGRFLAELAFLEHDLRRRTPHPLVGPPSLHAARLEGGSGLSTYAACSKVQIERRTIPGETEAQAVSEIEAILNRLSNADPDFHATVRPFFVRDPFEADPDSTIVSTLEMAAGKVLGRLPARIGDTPWMDAALLKAAGVDTVVFGPTGAGAHAEEEWVDLESVVQLATVLAEAALEYCR